MHRHKAGKASSSKMAERGSGECAEHPAPSWFSEQEIYFCGTGKYRSFKSYHELINKYALHKNLVFEIVKYAC